jgi:hypothetical protein
VHIKLVDGAARPYSISQLRRDNPQVSFPADAPVEVLSAYGVFPARVTEAPKPGERQVVESAGYLQSADGAWATAWRLRDMTAQELEQLLQSQEDQRRQAYQQEADPLFFKWQRGEATQQDWLNKVAEIKARQPD